MGNRSIPTVLPAVSGLFAAFCPACVPALAVFLPTLGLGFLANVTVDRTLTLVFLGLALIALHISAFVHRRSGAFVLAVVGAMGIIAGRNVFLRSWLIYGSGALLVGACALDYWYRRHAGSATCPAPIPSGVSRVG